MTSPKTFIEPHREMEKVLGEERVGYLGLSVQGSPEAVCASQCFVGPVRGLMPSLAGAQPSQ